MKKIVSVSLGSKAGDFTRVVEFNALELHLTREGTDGSWQAAYERVQELDGNVDAIGLGGIDIYLYVGSEQLIIGDGMRLKEAAMTTPVVDGSGLKNTLERRVVRDLIERDLVGPTTKILMVSALDRFGMAEAFVEAGCDCTFGDLIFNIGLDFPLRTLSEIEDIAKKYRKRLLTVPFHMLYPTGTLQDTQKPDERYAKYYESADIIAGDAHLILKHLPSSISGKGIVTNTTRKSTVERLRAAGASWLMTTTPDLQGISGGTNLMEAALVAMIEKPAVEITPADYAFWTERLGWHGAFTQF